MLFLLLRERTRGSLFRDSITKVSEIRNFASRRTLKFQLVFRPTRDSTILLEIRGNLNVGTRWESSITQVIRRSIKGSKSPEIRIELISWKDAPEDRCIFFFFFFFLKNNFCYLDDQSDLKRKRRKVNVAIGNVNESIRSECRSTGTVKAECLFLLGSRRPTRMKSSVSLQRSGNHRTLTLSIWNEIKLLPL